MPRYRDVEVIIHNRRPNSTEMYEIKKTYTIVFDEFHNGDPVRPESEQVEDFLERVYGYTKGLHYLSLTINTIKEHNNINKMAKKNKEIEEAQVLEETANPVKEQEVETAEVISEEGDTKYEAKLPAVPDKFIVNGNEHSLAEVEKLSKDADELITLATPETYEDKEFWDKVDRKRLDARDQRTKLESQRKKLTKPINDALSEFKKKTDTIGNAAKVVEDKLQAIVTLRDNWAEEQEKIRLEAIRKRTEQRKESLRELGGKYSYENDAFSFEYAPGIFINSGQLDDMTDEEWAEERSAVVDQWNEEQARIQKEKEENDAKLAEAEQKTAEADAAKKQLAELREMLLLGNGYEKLDNGTYTKNGWFVTESEMLPLSNQEFIDLTRTHNEPAVIEPTPEPSPLEPVSAPSGIDLPPVDTDVPEEPKDALDGVISGMVEQHNEHQDKVDGVKRVVLEFTKEKPYIDVIMGKSILRITHEDYEDVSLSNIDADKEVIAKNYIGENLILSAIGTPKKK